MKKRTIDVFVLGSAHYYRNTPLIKALEHNAIVRSVDKERASTNPIEWSNTIFIDPNTYFSDEDQGYSRAERLIRYIRNEYPSKVIVMCSKKEIIEKFVEKYGNQFSHYFQLDYENVGEPPDPIVDKIVEQCQVELERNIHSIYKYDVALSFADEDRLLVEEIAGKLKGEGVRVFYDKYEEANLWGKNLYEHLAWVYKDAAQYCVMFLSENYKKKLWTSHERQNAQARAFTEQREYILPVKMDSTAIPGITDTTAYIDIHKKTPKEISELVIEKING